jgi:glycogen operon protein
VFGPVVPHARCRSVNFLAAHDGFTLADTVSYERRHNWANGEGNRDGHGENFSWNHGVEGSTGDAAVLAARKADLKAMLGTLFASTGTIMLTAGDEFGRTQHGNNNAYCQDNAIGWVDWEGRDRELEDFVAGLSAARTRYLPAFQRFEDFGAWHARDGEAMTVEDWERPGENRLGWAYTGEAGSLQFTIDREARVVSVVARAASS